MGLGKPESKAGVLKRHQEYTISRSPFTPTNMTFKAWVGVLQVLHCWVGHLLAKLDACHQTLHGACGLAGPLLGGSLLVSLQVTGQTNGHQLTIFKP
jgi:hypothetical protein